MTVTTTEDTKVATDGNRGAVTATTAPVAPTSDHLVESDLLVEDVSIDGMCGVY
jgi:mycofactocin precursor